MKEVSNLKEGLSIEEDYITELSSETIPSGTGLSVHSTIEEYRKYMTELEMNNPYYSPQANTLEDVKIPVELAISEIMRKFKQKKDALDKMIKELERHRPASVGKIKKVEYDDKESRKQWRVTILKDGLVYDGRPKLELISMKETPVTQEGYKKLAWVIGMDGEFYFGPYNPGVRHHTSFFGKEDKEENRRVLSAGRAEVESGRIKKIDPLSGHYKTPPENFEYFFDVLLENARAKSCDPFCKNFNPERDIAFVPREIFDQSPVKPRIIAKVKEFLSARRPPLPAPDSCRIS